MPEQKLNPVQGGPIWLDLSTHDLDGAQRFYSELLGWSFQDGGEEFGHYHTITHEGRAIGGAMSSLMGPDGPTEEPNGPTTWTVYLRTSDIAATVSRAESAGAQVLFPPMDVSDLGSMTVLSDPAGAAVGLWQPGTFDGIQAAAAPGLPCWFECMSTDYDASEAFYRDVLDWDIARMGEDEAEQSEDAPSGVRYATHGAGEAAAAGLCEAASFLPEGTPSFWRVYFGAEDVDDALLTATRLGGTVLDGPMDSPFGRLATVADPQGASFQIIQAV